MMKKNEFKKGDTVSVLDDIITGIVTKVNGNTITIETSDEFTLQFERNELVKIEESLPVHLSVKDIQEKEQPKRRKQPKKNVKDRYQPTLEVDLHIHHLTDKSNRMTNHDMLTLQLDTARRQLEFAMRKRIQKIVFIHGVGEGVLKMELEYLFGRYNNVKYYDADYQKYGLGATEVYIFQNIEPN